jgi:putative ABC transport system substrate-binding protein
MKKAYFSFILTALLFVLCLSADAQQPKKIPRIGYLGEADLAMTEGFRQGLRDLGKNIVIEYRNEEREQLPLADLASDLVRLNVDVIVTGGEATYAAKNATKTIPIVMVNVGQPLALGLVAGLARPGGNITGLSNSSSPDLWGKRLELLKESVPKVSRMAVLWNPSNPTSIFNMKTMETPARSLGIKLQSLEIREPNDLEKAFSVMKNEHDGAFVTISSNLIVNQLKRIVKLATRGRLPGMYGDIRFVEAGGLMCYGTSFPDLYRRAATYVDKILKGAKPADLPVEQPMKFELIINLKAAKQIGLTIPPNVLARADRVIK